MNGIQHSQELFSTAYDKGFTSTVRFLISRGARFDEAEEIAQSAWARGWEAREQIANPSSLLPWINTIAFRVFSKERRRQQRFDSGEPHAVSPNPFRRLAAGIDAMTLAARCAALDQKLLIGRYLGDAPFEELGRRHGLTAVAARIRVHRAIHSLREFAGESDFRRAAA